MKVENGKPERLQAHHNVFIYVDEGEILKALGTRQGSTLLPTVRSIWTGNALGQANASADRKRIVPKGSYVYGIVVSLQATKAGPLLEDVAAGTPQRFVWASATDPSIDNYQPWPGAISFRRPLPEWIGAVQDDKHRLIPVATSVEHEIKALNEKRAKGFDQADDLDNHGELLKLKMAALLATLDGRFEVSEEDWRLAGLLKTTSDGVRTATLEVLQTEAQDQEKRATNRQVSRKLAEVQAIELSRFQKAMNSLAWRVDRNPGITKRQLRTDMRKFREEFSDAYENALAIEWIRTEPANKGSIKIFPGSKLPRAA